MFQRKQQHLIWEQRFLDIQVESGKSVTVLLWFGRFLFHKVSELELLTVA